MKGATVRTDRPTNQHPHEATRGELRGSRGADRFAWVDASERLVRNKQSWVVSIFLIVAFVPLVAWSLTSISKDTRDPGILTDTEGSDPVGPSQTGAASPAQGERGERARSGAADSSFRSTEPTLARAPVGPTARFGGDTTRSSTTVSPTTVTTVAATGPSPDDSIIEHPYTTVLAAPAVDEPSTQATPPLESTTSTEPTTTMVDPTSTTTTGPTSATDPSAGSSTSAVSSTATSSPSTSVATTASTDNGAGGNTTEAPAGPCHPSYSGCLPIVIDIDCEGLTAPGGDPVDRDGPVFVSGPVLVTGDDVYRLDPNGDLVACHDGDDLP